MAFDDAGDGVGEIGVRLDAAELAGLDQGRDGRPVLGAAVGAGEQSVLAVQGNRPVILPMSGMRSSSITAGTRFMGVVSGATTASSASPVASFMSRWGPAWLRSWRRGCWTPSPAPR